MTEPAEVIVRREGRAGRLTLNRPKALNALTLGMVRTLWETLQQWQSDPKVEVVILDGAGDRGLCAGGDILSLYASAKDGVGFAANFWREEYQLNALIHRYPKPFVAIMDGIVMGGGIGLSAHARHRIATERSTLAMPETTIGLIPDVGGTWILSRGSPGIGNYLGLTGYRMTGSDAIQAGFAQSFVTTNQIPSLLAALSEPAGPTIDDIIDEHEVVIPQSALSTNQTKIESWFNHPTLEDILDALSSTTDPLAIKARADLATRSPLALKLTLQAIRRARSFNTLEEALNTEYRLCTNIFQHGEFIEGIRALLVDKDKAPNWNPPRLDDVTADMVASFFQANQSAGDIHLKNPKT
jgi:enoyl-CoA hydratase